MLVRFTGIHGMNHQIERAKQYLTLNKVYRVVKKTTQNWVTTYQLEGIKGEWNSVLFENN